MRYKKTWTDGEGNVLEFSVTYGFVASGGAASARLRKAVKVLNEEDVDSDEALRKLVVLTARGEPRKGRKARNGGSAD